ncbi:MAG: DUF2461 family protein, partial [Saprospiraceae bacterium]|nr:DUF2461 family protein [Saprospiraceae bacterium]
MKNIQESTFRFLAELRENNNREWFTANKARYEAAHKNFLEFTDALIAGIGQF